MVKSLLVLAAVLSLLSGCGGGPTSTERTQAPTPDHTRQAELGVVQFNGNRVPEEPWWQVQTAPETKPSEPPLPAPQREVYEISGDVLFAESSASLNDAASSQLRHLADMLVGDPSAVVDIVGHTDGTPGPTVDYNDALSRARANSVRDWLVQNGVAIDHIGTEGRADRAPIASNETDAGRSANRRVTITIRRTS